MRLPAERFKHLPSKTPTTRVVSKILETTQIQFRSSNKTCLPALNREKREISRPSLICSKLTPNSSNTYHSVRLEWSNSGWLIVLTMSWNLKNSVIFTKWDSKMYKITSMLCLCKNGPLNRRCWCCWRNDYFKRLLVVLNSQTNEPAPIIVQDYINKNLRILSIQRFCPPVSILHV